MWTTGIKQTKKTNFADSENGEWKNGKNLI